MNNKLTPREQAIIEFIKTNIRAKGYPPSVREIGHSVGLKSSSTVHNYLRRMEEKGVIRRDPTKPRALEILEGRENLRSEETVTVPLLGRVAAGQPLLAVENHDSVLPLPSIFFGEGELFMLTVRGDSMIEAGIHEGDIVVVRRQPVANNGDIVVALIEDEATVKTFYRENSNIRLQPENRLLDPIIVKEVSILGKVVGLLRKY